MPEFHAIDRLACTSQLRRPKITCDIVGRQLYFIIIIIIFTIISTTNLVPFVRYIRSYHMHYTYYNKCYVTRLIL